MLTTLRDRGLRRHVQPAVQDYLKAIQMVTLDNGGRRARTNAIAAQLGVSAPSVSAMLERLAADGLVDHVHYAGALLTTSGQAAALSVIRRHRLVELYLHRVLGLGWEEVHEEAELLEHALSPRVEAAMDAALGYPSIDPHGDPIPGSDGSLESPPPQACLWDSPAGVTVRVTRVVDTDPELLRHFRRLGIVPGARLSRVSRESGGLLRLRVGRREAILGRDAAEKVYVAVG